MLTPTNLQALGLRPEIYCVAAAPGSLSADGAVAVHEGDRTVSLHGEPDGAAVARTLKTHGFLP